MKRWLKKAVELLKESLEAPTHELNALDWKMTLSPNKEKLTAHLSAFANYAGGGFLVFGIDPNAVPVGIEKKEEVDVILKTLTNLGRSALEPLVQLEHAVEDYESVRLLFVHIPESAVKPVHLRGKGIEESFIRSGGSTRKASRQEVATLMLHSKTPRWENLYASTLLTEEELMEQLNVEPIFKMLEHPMPSNSEELRVWMAGENFITRDASDGGYITNLGAIAAAKRLTNFSELSRKAIRVIVYDGLTKARTKLEQEGNKGYAIGFQGLVQSVMSLLPQSEVIKEALRKTQTVYPEIALREIIANALIHQDFSITGAGPLIEIYDNRIEISNPGGLLPSKRLDRLIGTQPESRNEKLARAFRRYKICEERGSGLIKAGEQVEFFGLPPIHFEEGTNYFKVTLFSPLTFAQMSPRERLDACYQHAVLKYYAKSAMTNTSLRERLKMPEKQRSMVSVLIQEAVDKKLIKLADEANKSKKFAEYIPIWA